MSFRAFLALHFAFKSNMENTFLVILKFATLCSSGLMQVIGTYCMHNIFNYSYNSSSVKRNAFSATVQNNCRDRHAVFFPLSIYYYKCRDINDTLYAIEMPNHIYIYIYIYGKRQGILNGSYSVTALMEHILRNDCLSSLSSRSLSNLYSSSPT